MFDKKYPAGMYHGDNKRMKVSTGYNEIMKKFYISITDRETKITLRIDMEEEHYNNFFGIGKFTLRQTVKNDIERVLKTTEKTEKQGFDSKGLFP